MFRAAHSLKGLSGMLRLDDINGLTHKVENILDAARNGELAVTGNVVEVVYRALDRLDLMISLLNDCDRTAVDCVPVLKSIDQILIDSGTARAISSQKDADLAWDNVQPAPSKSPRLYTPAETAPMEFLDLLAGMEDDKDTPAKYLAIFVDEGHMTLDSISATLLSSADDNRLESLLVCFHRLKGSAASIGLQRIARLALSRRLLARVAAGQCVN